MKIIIYTSSQGQNSLRRTHFNPTLGAWAREGGGGGGGGRGRKVPVAHNCQTIEHIEMKLGGLAENYT